MELQNENRPRRVSLNDLRSEFNQEKVSREKYMKALEDNYDILEPGEITTLNEWRKEIDQKLEAKRSHHDSAGEQNKLQFERSITIMVLIGVVVLVLILIMVLS